MMIKSARLGEIAAEEQNIIHFDSGILAFEDLTRFVLLDIPENLHFKWLQSVEDTDLTFLLVDPFTIKEDYYVELSDETAAELEISIPEEVLVYTIVTVPKTGLKDATTNLIGPLIINWTKKKAKQIIFEKPENMIKYPLLPKDSRKLCYGG